MSHKKNSEEPLYYIKVKGNLDCKWADWFEGFELTSCGDQETLLSGKVADQAALYGILNKIIRLGLPLLFVAQIEYLSNSMACPVCGRPVELVKER
jgi:argonaute-like protein implicated in RNA metabolism and viral defense